MKETCVLSILLALLQLPALAQIEVTTDTGDTVQLGPGGVAIHTRYGKKVEAKSSGDRVPAKTNQLQTNQLQTNPPKTNLSKANQSKTSQLKTSQLKTSPEKTTTPTTNTTKAAGANATAAAGAVSKTKTVPATSSELPAKVQALMMLSGSKMGSSKKPLPSVIEVSADDIILYDNNVNQTLTCTNNGVVVQGNHCSLSVVGNCKVLSVSGNFNTVRCENVGAISVPGNHNTIFYLKGLNGQKHPNVNVSGNSNSCSKVK